MTATTTKRSSWLLGLITMMIVFLVCFVIGELMVRYAKPQISKYPRQAASIEYGITNFPNTSIQHTVPGEWEYEYTTNRFGHRGDNPVISNIYTTPNIVVLGDSFTFGQGVSDGEEYPAVMQRRLGDKAQVVNLGMPGWGLTQQIRRYYELGQVFQPKVVVLAFCNNDPVDNMRYPVTRIENGAFVFQPVETEFAGLKSWLSKSWIQKSQLYNFVRGTAYELLRDKESFPDFAAAEENANPEPTPNEINYVTLLQAFAQDLKANNVPLVMIAVNGQLKQFPHIQNQVDQFNLSGLMRYVEVMEWTGPSGLGLSPEGHWGAETQKVNGEKLADLLAQDYL